MERVTFHSEDSGFCVLQVKARGIRGLATVVGTLARVAPGEWVDASGRWTVDPRHGQQFRAETLRTTPPRSVEGVERYLASGALKGIGPQLASRLVAAFGAEVFDVIENHPDRLRRVEGIGPVRQRRLQQAWRDQLAVQEIMVFLHSHGIGTGRAFRIHRTWGAEAIERIRANPYDLAREIRGIGFASADRVAASLGIEPTSDIRARAGVEHVLLELTDEGHCAAERNDLEERAVRVLDIPADIVAAAVDHGIATGRLNQHDIDGRRLVYLATLDHDERALADRLVALAAGRHPCPPIRFGSAVEWVEARTGITLAGAQRDALRAATASKVVVITGGPGVGKTTIIDALVRIMTAKRLQVVLAAPTGRAAKRMGEVTGRPASTIHRLLEFDPATGGFTRDEARPLHGDVFIIDETSMVDLPLAWQLLRAVPLHAAVVLVGDVDQLPSVGPGMVLRDTIDSGVLTVCRLTEIFRQAAESRIVTNAHRVNAGRMPEWPEGRTDESSDFYLVEADDPARGVELVTRLVTGSIPDRFGFAAADQIQVLTPMQRGELGARNLNQVLQQALNPVGEEIRRFGWIFRTGDRVMQIVNDYDKDVFNGDVGRIERLDAVDGRLEVRFDQRIVEYEAGELDELVLAYAATIHKAQGSEYPAVVIPLHTQHYPLLQRNLLYTAITRGRRLVVLVGSRRALHIAVSRVDARRRVTTLAHRLRRAAANGAGAGPLFASPAE